MILDRNAERLEKKKSSERNLIYIKQSVIYTLEQFLYGASKYHKRV